MKAGTGLLAGHRERHADRGEELLAADLLGGLGLVLRLCLGLDGVLRDGLVRLHRCRGDGRHAQFLEAVFRFLERRVDLKRLAEVSDGLLFIALLFVGVAPVVVGKEIIRVQRDGLAVVRDGAAMLALLSVGEAPVVVGVGIVRVERDGLGVIGDGAVILALAKVVVAPAVWVCPSSCRTQSEHQSNHKRPYHTRLHAIHSKNANYSARWPNRLMQNSTARLLANSIICGRSAEIL